MLNTVKLAGILVVIGCSFGAGPVWAQCVEGTTDGLGRTPVPCDTADETDGYAATVDQVDVVVAAGFDVAHGAATEAILLLEDSTVVNDGTITATADDTQGVEAGNNATVTNQGIGVIQGGGGATGAAIVFSGLDSAANNVVNNNDNGVITTSGTGTVAIQGGVGNEIVTLSDTSTLTGDIILGGGDDIVTIQDDATATGNVDLGDGTNQFDISGTADLTGTITGRAGNDVITIRESGVVGESITLGNGTNSVTVSDTAMFSSDITGGADDDTVSITDRATVIGSINLGGGNDTLTIDADANYDGTINAGAGADDISFLGSTTILSGEVNLGDGTDSFTLDAATYAGNVTAGDGTNTISIQNQATFSGDYTGGDDADIFVISSDSAISGVLTLGNGENRVTVAGGNATTLFTSSIVGGVDEDVVRLQAGARYGVDVDAGGSMVDLGEGDDTFTTGRDQVIFADVDLGPGDDTFTIGSPDSNATSEFNGNVDLGQTGDDPEVDPGDDPDAFNVFTLSDDALMIGDVYGGAGVDQVDVLNNAELIGSVDLGGGADNLTLNSGSSITGTVDLGGGDDFFVYNTSDGSVPGPIILGDGADTFFLESGATLPSSIDPGDDDDTLHLDRRLTATQIEGVVDLSTATEFEALLIGPDIQEDGYRWRVLTSGEDPAAFGDTKLLSGDLILEGNVRLDSPLTHNGGATPPTVGAPPIPAPVMVFELGPGGPTDPSNSHLDLTGKLTLVGRDPGADSEDPVDDTPGAASRVDFTGTIVDGTYTLITASGGIETDGEMTEGFDVETLPVSAAFSFSTAIVAGEGAIPGTYALTVLRELIYNDFARSDSEANVGGYFEDARLAGAATSFSDVTNALDLLGAGDLRTALVQSSPEVYDAHTSSVLSWGRVQRRVLQERSMRCDRYTSTSRPDVVSDSPCGATGFMPWAKVVGNLGDHKGGESSGYETMGGGVLLGIDYRWDDTLWLSGDIGFARIDIDHDNGADGEFDSVDLGVAAGGEFFGVTTRGSFTYSHGFHETNRKVDFLNERAKGKHDSDRVTLAAGAGYRLKAGPFVVEPNATVDYTHVDEDSVDESGVGAVNLDVSSRKTDLVSLTGGVRLGANFLKYRYSGAWLEWADGVWSPDVSVGWRQGFGDVDRDQKAKMQDAPGGIGSFKAEAEDSAGGVEVGAHVSFQPLNTATSVEFGYDGYFGDDVTNHAANVSVRIPF